MVADLPQQEIELVKNGHKSTPTSSAALPYSIYSLEKNIFDNIFTSILLVLLLGNEVFETLYHIIPFTIDQIRMQVPIFICCITLQYELQRNLNPLV